MSKRTALIVGIDKYEHFFDLNGAVQDAKSIHELLAYNGDEVSSQNFECRLLVGDNRGFVNREQLIPEIRTLFEDKHQDDVALFYYAGHGALDTVGGFLIPSDCSEANLGIPLSQIVDYANRSKAAHKIIILDCCHSGSASEIGGFSNLSLLGKNVTILTACRRDESADEIGFHGIFTSLLIDALEGAAASLMGDITPGSVYSHIDRSLGAFDQRPVIKINAETFVSLRKVTPPISLENLRRIAEFFPEKDCIFALDPSYEREERGRLEGMVPPDDEHTKVFSILQQMNRVNLVVPTGGTPHMWHAAMESKGCRLTRLGKHYWNLAKRGLL